MQLPFTRQQFFDLFADYNEALWPAIVVLWIISAVVSLRLLSPRRPPDRWICALLAAHWLWSAVAYHAAFFTRINPAAWLFAALFLAEAGLLWWVGVVQRRLSFVPRRSAITVLAGCLVAYSLLYPAINAAAYHSVSRIPAFAVPCPTTNLHGRHLGVRADFALLIAGIALGFSSGWKGTRLGNDSRHREVIHAAQ